MSPRSSAHPRRCGENGGRAYSSSPQPGSSPQVRGKRHSLFQGIRSNRLIPAGAGKTRVISPAPPLPTAHPRRCGENVDGKRVTGTPSGSSPQVRGKHNGDSPKKAYTRLIPAGAGKTRDTTFRRRPIPAHPRRCGENQPSHTRRSLTGGSSPQVRGKPRRTTRSRARARLIPAGAGKTQANPR